VGLVEGRVRVFVAQGDEELADLEVAEGGGEVEVGVGQAGCRGVRVVEEVRVGLEDALDEERVVGVDRSSETEGGFDPEVPVGNVVSWAC